MHRRAWSGVRQTVLFGERTWQKRNTGYARN